MKKTLLFLSVGVFLCLFQGIANANVAYEVDRSNSDLWVVEFNEPVTIIHHTSNKYMPYIQRVIPLGVRVGVKPGQWLHVCRRWPHGSGCFVPSDLDRSSR